MYVCTEYKGKNCRYASFQRKKKTEKGPLIAACEWREDFKNKINYWRYLGPTRFAERPLMRLA